MNLFRSQNNPIALLSTLLDVFLPNLCLFCRTPLLNEGAYLCLPCWQRLPVFPERSNEPMRTLRGVLDRLFIGWVYEVRVRQLIHLFKYHCRLELAAQLAAQWLNTLAHPERLQEYDLLLPVPIHSARLRWRGFNQSELLAQALSGLLGLPIASRQAVRMVNTPSQTHLNREQRWRSVAQAFELIQTEKLHNRRILIVDDLATSGATLNALALLLRRCGAPSVSAAVLTSPELVS